MSADMGKDFHALFHLFLLSTSVPTNILELGAPRFKKSRD
jgi:hypothetical protein